MKTPIVIILTFQAIFSVYASGAYYQDYDKALPHLVMALLNIAALIMVTV